uniref:Ig-like domain-containing protein n=1 Tax=Anopheles culicifacies TaxID=139723 RepID=A0A182M3P7_9DIPT
MIVIGDAVGKPERQTKRSGKGTWIGLHFYICRAEPKLLVPINFILRGLVTVHASTCEYGAFGDDMGTSFGNSLSDPLLDPDFIDNPPMVQPKFTSRSQSVRAVIGDTITLPCEVENLGGPINLRDCTYLGGFAEPWVKWIEELHASEGDYIGESL